VPLTKWGEASNGEPGIDCMHMRSIS
jgi:hypothetical protein